AVAGGRYNGRVLRSGRRESSIERWQRWLGGPRQTGLAGKDDEKSLRRLGAPALAEAQKQPYPLPALFSLLDTLLEARSRLMRQRREQLAAAKAQALQQVNARLSADKARRGVISFNDLLLALSAALRGPHAQELARLLGTRYHAALIDEFQDTDPLQFGVFERIFVTQHKGASDKSACIFLVGDPKQAIYSFRGADLYAYLDARQRAATRHTLTTNRRSVPPLVDGVSQLFAQAKAPFLLDQLDYPPVDALDDKASLRIDGAAQPALSWAWLDEAASSKEQGLREACTQSADAIARLLALGSSGRALLGERPVSAGDIAVLAASHHQISAVQAALRDRGIASVRIGRDSVFGTEEAQALLQVLLALLEPGDRQVRAVLASHLGGLHAAALQSLAADEAAWDALLAQYRHWQQLWQRRGLLAALEGWLLDSGVAERLADWQDGERRLANLLHLFELVEQEARQRHGMHALINWYRSALAGGSEETDTRLLRLESDAARVRLVTIHASKGLQYPIVFCPFLWDGKRDEALYDAAQLSEDDSLALAHDADGTAVLDFGSPQRPMRLAQARRERVSERLRLLYVALTRAESQLVLHWGAVSGADTSALGWLLAGGEQQDLDASQWQARLNALLEQHAGTMGWLTLPADTGSAVMAAPTPVPQVARLNRHLRWRWQMSSFSSLTAGLHDERPDHDAGAAPVLDTVPEADTESAPAPVYYRDIATFPAGAHAGVMLHSVFEEWDFAREDQDALRDHATQMLEKHGFDSAWADGIANLVNTTLHSAITPFGDRLHGLGKRKKLVELEFTFSLRPFAWPQLQGLLSRPEYGLPASFAQAARQLRSEVASGYLKGFIDLSCELGGRYWVLDYKSNKLGTSPADYTATAVEAAMANEHYYLQALIYCVALHRYLKWRRPDYDHAHHFGGASYLFLRGLDPAVPLQGVWAYTPPLSLLEALEQLLCGG
ncbi:UvrD-helicase domain-containing protein, partial [Chitinimonas sp.]|uniref:UvrD-helicase domain-containing protein n=1 Tax=Chitinimonas sp. TaxID=1934313 RepID=UPI0035B36AA1